MANFTNLRQCLLFVCVLPCLQGKSNSEAALVESRSQTQNQVQVFVTLV